MSWLLLLLLLTQAARAAATAAALHHLGEPIPRAVNESELMHDAPGAVDFDCSVVVATPEQLALAYQPTDVLCATPSRCPPVGTLPALHPADFCSQHRPPGPDQQHQQRLFQSKVHEDAATTCTDAAALSSRPSTATTTISSSDQGGMREAGTLVTADVEYGGGGGSSGGSGSGAGLAQPEQGLASCPSLRLPDLSSAEVTVLVGDSSSSYSRQQLHPPVHALEPPPASPCAADFVAAGQVMEEEVSSGLTS
ncbi:hypothetical protein V8C86DRAFT_2564695 [Haematococcus lacustris]